MEKIKKERVIKIGAEAELWYGVWLGLPAVFKIRKAKRYRPPELDKRVRSLRTINEVKLMYQAGLIGVNVPAIYYVSLNKFLIVMEYIEGYTLKTLLEKHLVNDVCKVFSRLGEYIGLLHRNGIIHGDLTTSNIIVRKGELFFIDFGLGEISKRIEDMGVDLHLFRRALESAHHDLAEEIFECMMEGYIRVVGSRTGKAVIDKVREIRMRGRYVSERRLAC